MTSPHSETRALQFVVAALLAVALGFLFAVPSGAASNDGCYPSCTTTSSGTNATSTSVVEDTTTTAEVTTTAQVTTTEQSTTTVAASSTDSSDGGGSLPVTGGDILVMTMVGFAAVAVGGLFLATSKNRKLQGL